MISFPFTSDSGDRKVYTKDFRALFSKYFTNGVFNGEFTVTPATGMKVNVSAGACNINGVFAYSDDNTEMPIETVSSETYFNIVLRLDDNKASRNVGLYVVKGTSTPPELTRNETVYELCIARIKVGASDQSITLSMIEDTRLNTDLCGIVANAVQTLDTDTYYNQLQGKLDEVIDIVDQALDETLAGSLQNQINERIKITDIVDNLESTDTDKPLSANQGNVLANKIKGGRLPLFYVNGNELQATINLEGEIESVTANVIPVSQTPYNQGTLYIELTNENKKIVLRFIGEGLVPGHTLSCYWMAKLK